MLRLICGSALTGLVTVAPASSQTVPAPDRQLLVDKWHFEEEGIAVDVSLNADSTAVYSVEGSVGIRTSTLILGCDLRDVSRYDKYRVQTHRAGPSQATKLPRWVASAAAANAIVSANPAAVSITFCVASIARVRQIAWMTQSVARAGFQLRTAQGS